MENKKLSPKDISELKSDGVICEEEHNKILIEISYSYLKDGDLEAALAVLCKINPDYFLSQELIKQTEEDPAYLAAVTYLGYKLVQCGVVDVGFNPTLTQFKVAKS